MTDLTGTTWYFNSIVNLPPGAAEYLWDINFTINDGSVVNCTRFNLYDDGIDYTGFDWVYDEFSGWIYEDARTIHITGGTDATNATLIAWLQANAVQQGGSTGYTGTITSSGYNSTVQYVRYPSDSSGTTYYTAGDTISVTEGDSVYFYCNAGPTNNIYLDGTSVGTTSYTWTPDADFEVAFTASIASWGRIDITRNVPSTPGVIITYDSATVTSITEDGTITLPTNGKYMSTDVVVSGTDVYSTEITYNGNTIATGTGTFTKTLQCADKVMNSNVGITVQIEEPVEPEHNCVTFFTSASDNSTYLQTANNLKNWNGTLEYSYDKSHWNTWDGTTNLTFQNGYLYLRGTGNTYLTGSSSSSTSYRFMFLGSGATTLPSGAIECSGNIETLLDWATVKAGNHPIMASYCFSYLFQGANGLKTAPELPSTSLATYCYQYMFQNCTGLTTTPALPATTTASYCYRGMFYGCTALTTITRPTGKTVDLPATTLATYCYNLMFRGCTNLVNGPSFTASVVNTYCCSQMFYGCTKLTNPSITLSDTSVTSNCYASMFYNCKAITATIALPATSLATSCYNSMYYGCSALTTITIPSGKTSALPATTLATQCYRYMFQACTSLTTPPSLPATTLNTYCYQYMFRGCTNLTSIPALPATTVSNYAYGYMFYGCTKIKISSTQTGDYQNAYRIPTSGSGSFGTNSVASMFTSTGGTYTSNPTVNTTYYTSNTVVS